MDADGGSKALEYYLGLEYPIRLTRSSDPEEEEYWVAEIPDLPGCMSDGSTPGEAIESVEEAKALWVSTRLEDGYTVPEPSPREFSGRILLRLPKGLHKQLSVQAHEQGTSLNQLVIHLLSRSVETLNLEGRLDASHWVDTVEKAAS